jgi:hypothetical protein
MVVMTIDKEGARKLYEGKFFYKVEKIVYSGKSVTPSLTGPFNNIRYIAMFVPETEGMVNGDFVEIKDGKIINFLNKEQVLVTDRKL